MHPAKFYRSASFQDRESRGEKIINNIEYGAKGSRRIPRSGLKLIGRRAACARNFIENVALDLLMHQ